MSYLLTQENSDNFNTLNSSITNLIKYSEIKNVELTNDEKFLYDKISTKFSEFTPKKNKKKKNENFYDKYKIWFTIGFIVLGFVLFYLRFIRRDNKIKIILFKLLLIFSFLRHFFIYLF